MPKAAEAPARKPAKASSTKLSSPAPDAIAWQEADKGYALAIVGGKLVARNPQGKKLASVPKALKETELAEQLVAACEWLAEHRMECLRQIELWMLRSLPVPREVLQAVWPDPDWSGMLQNLVVVAADAKGAPQSEQTGLLRDVDTKRGIGVVDRDGETQWLKSPQVLIPHPILIDGLEDLREISSDMNFQQSVEQLYRPIFSATAEQKESKRIADFTSGKFEQLNFVLSLCRRLGYPVRGGYACNKVWENGTPLEARFWVGEGYPEGETYTEDLIFVDQDQMPQSIVTVGPVTFSEGMRMASQIYAKRKVEQDEQEGEDA